MNTRSSLHIPEDVLEEYAMGMLPEQGCAPVEEHLLICPYCQCRLDAADAYIRIVKTAVSLLPSRALGFGEHAPAAKIRAVATVG